MLNRGDLRFEVVNRLILRACRCTWAWGSVSAMYNQPHLNVLALSGTFLPINGDFFACAWHCHKSLSKTAIPTEIPVPLACGQQGNILLYVNGTSDCCPAIDYHLYHLCWKTTWGWGSRGFSIIDCSTSTLLAVACSARHSQPVPLPFHWSVRNGFLICVVMLPSAGLVRQKSSWLTRGNLSKKYFSIWEWNHCGSLSDCELKAGLSALQAFPSAGNTLNSMLPFQFRISPWLIL